MFIIWRFVLSVLAALTLGLMTITRRSKIFTAFAVVFLIAILGLAVGVTIDRVQEHQTDKAIGLGTVPTRTLTPSGLPTNPPAPWTPQMGSGSSEHPTGAAAPSPLRETH